VQARRRLVVHVPQVLQQGLLLVQANHQLRGRGRVQQASACSGGLRSSMSATAGATASKAPHNAELLGAADSGVQRHGKHCRLTPRLPPRAPWPHAPSPAVVLRPPSRHPPPRPQAQAAAGPPAQSRGCPSLTCPRWRASALPQRQRPAAAAPWACVLAGGGAAAGRAPPVAR
jgi:hypothetical protein